MGGGVIPTPPMTLPTVALYLYDITIKHPPEGVILIPDGYTLGEYVNYLFEPSFFKELFNVDSIAYGSLGYQLVFNAISDWYRLGSWSGGNIEFDDLIIDDSEIDLSLRHGMGSLVFQATPYIKGCSFEILEE